MSEKIPVFRLSQDAYNQLTLVARETPELYLDPDMDFDGLLRERGLSDCLEPTDIYSDGPICLAPVDSGAPNQADIQALDFYHSLTGMSPRQALDMQMWSWMTHFQLHDYCLKRWRRPNKLNLSNYVLRHWLSKGQSGAHVWQDNTASRTWWIAHAAINAAKGSAGAFDANDALKVFADTAVFYHLLMKYNFTREPMVMGEVVRVLLNEAEGINAEKGLYAILKELNYMGGTQVLPLMPRETLRDRILDVVDDVMSNPELVRDRSKLRNRKVFRSLSLGAGVQSTALALMAEHGEYGLVKPDVAIFADTGWEPPAVYEHLEWLREQVSFEIVRVEEGNLRENILAGKSPYGREYLGIPAWLINSDGTQSVARRQCTTNYKVRPINRYLKERMGIEPGKRAPKHISVEIWMGISADEPYRVKDSQEEWATNRYPLVDLGLSRAQCLNWFQENYPGRALPRSACIGCPYKTDNEWKWLQNNDSESFEHAVFIDKVLREVPVVQRAITKNGAKAFLHRSRTPLGEIDFSNTKDYDEVMIEECDGVCWV